MAKKNPGPTVATAPGRRVRTPAAAPPVVVMQPLHDKARREAIFDAVEDLEVSQTRAWNDLDALSSHTQVESVDLVPEAIFTIGSKDFAAAATVYVELQYGGKNDSISSADAFPAEVRGHFNDDGSAIVDELTVDTSSFYD